MAKRNWTRSLNSALFAVVFRFQGGCGVSAFRLPSVRLLLLPFGEWFVPASSRATAPFVCSDRTSNAGAMPVRAQVPKTLNLTH